ncbi:PQQ-dependent sugar dehydrogenase [Thalassorhabdomicrobium marinisediminis]|uniref:Glucose dehydrogenase n=1 Tax=Thalassorhabdomicrobium marinisediminis TaxID=2170577 RepID=A0A2T7FZX6_9RHOB|nr:PQQ-dependent sugar dehydrogenase [Thalassorhabdomicrobium marinisediminis]PVA07732.1 glucose dehydrogenase [Thalassorhabdomicrobium marinisediminis]
MRFLMTSTFALLGLPLAGLAQVEQGPANADFQPAFETQTRAPALEATEVQSDRFIWGLNRPWGIAVLPDGDFLVTERPGTLRVVTPDALGEPIGGLPEVDPREQGGMLDVAVREDFAETRRVWWTYAKPVDGGVATAAATGVLSADGTQMSEVQDIFVQSPPSQNPMHYGSRIVFGDDGMAYITTGEHFSFADRELAQDLDTTYGKVVRVSPMGKVPQDNPFVGQDGMDEIWSYGHRNVQGAAVAEDGTLWTIEHGPKGGDELNRPVPGANFGWPVISYGVTYQDQPIGSGDAVRDGMEQPVYYWDPVIAPAGMAFHNGAGGFDWAGDLLIGSLYPGGLVRLTLEGGVVTGEERLLPDAGRVRDVEVLEDGSVLLLIDDPEGGILRVTAPD